MKKNVLIVNFNTQKLTDACIKSVNKTTPGCTIYVFDNSDKEPFINKFDNVEVIDNTEGHIIDFEKWLDEYPNRKRSGGKTNNWGSAKHAYTVEKCMETISTDEFILLDSDVLLKKDISGLFDSQFAYAAEVQEQDPRTKIKRVLPFICYINNKMCKENNIHYFSDDYMHGLRKTAKSDWYDTGAYFYLACEKFPHKEIKWEDYVVHYKAGSWTSAADKMRKTKHLTVDEWLKKYRSLWDENYEEPEISQEEKPKEQAAIAKISPTIPKYPQNRR